MTDSELLSIIRAHRADSLGGDSGELTDERAGAMNRYHGRPYGNEVEGRSAVVSRDIAEAVDWCMPGIMRVFVQSGALAEFDPVGPEDEMLAQQEGDYVNRVLMQDNNGFLVLHDAIKDTLLLKNGYTKRIWEDPQKKVREESYTGVTMDQIAMIYDTLTKNGAKEIEVVGKDASQVEIPTPNGPMIVELFDIKLRIVGESEGRLIWMAVPAEEVRVSKKCRGSLQDSPFCEHVTKKTRTALIEMGMPNDFVYDLACKNETDTSQQKISRDSVDDESDEASPSTGDRSMDEIEYCEAFIRVDYDGDGMAELRRIVTVGDEIPPGEEWNRPIEAVALTGYVAKRVPHRHVGESLDDELQDLQEIMTVLKRQLLDNIYRVNNAEMAINEDANLRDFMTSTPGGIKRIKGSGPVTNAFSSIQTPPIIDKLLPVVDFFDRQKQQRSGIAGPNSGVDPDVLQQTTKGAFMENLMKAGQKMEMIARMIAETGVKEDVQQAHALLMRHQDVTRQVQLRGKWVPVNPRDWRERNNLTVKVGIGTGSEEEKRAKLGMIAGMQGQLMQTLLSAPPEVYAKSYAMFEETAKQLGEHVPEKYAITPGGPEHQALMQQMQQQKQGGPGNPLAEAEQIKAQAAIQIAQAKQQAQMEIEAARQNLTREKEMALLQERFTDREAERRHAMTLEHMKQLHEDARETMRQEVKALLEGMRMDLGQQGISAGVQGAPGVPIEAIGQPVEPMMQQPMPPMMPDQMPPEGMP